MTDFVSGKAAPMGTEQKQLLLGKGLSKTLRIMKLTAVFLLFAALQVSAKGIAQEKISLSLKNASLEKVFGEIEAQTGFVFIYKDETVKDKRINIQVSNVTLSQALDECLKGQALSYQIVGKSVAIKAIKKDTDQIGGEPAGTPPFIDVRGRVVNEKGEPVEGVTVTVKGHSKKTLTDKNGEFSMATVEQDATLVFTHITMESFEVKVSGKTELVINLRTKVSALGDVVVTVNTGYQQIPKERATGSFEFVSKEEINRRTGVDLLSRLEGVSTSLLFDRRGMTGSETTFPVNNLLIRGVSTLTTGSMGAPLIILNNFPFSGDINTINPNDVENITILKDAAAASIYGAKASNGVIVITTRQGQYNQPMRFSINSNLIHTEKPDLFHYSAMSSSDYIDLEKFLFDKGYYDADLNDPGYVSVSPVVEILAKKRSSVITPQDAENQINALRDVDVRNDFEKYIYRSSLSQQYSINMNGGNDRFKYSLSSGFDITPSILKNNQFKRITVASDNSYIPFKDAQFQFGVRYANTDNRDNSLGDYGSSRYRYHQGSMTLYPYAKFADEEGNPLPIAKDYRPGYTDTAGNGKLLNWKYSPLDEMNNVHNKAKGQNLLLSTGFNIKVFPFLNVQLNYQYQHANQDATSNYDPQSYYARNQMNLYTNLNTTNAYLRNPIPVGGILDLINTKQISHVGRAQANFSKSWINKHEFNALAGAEIRETVSTSSGSRFYGYRESNLSMANVDYVNSFPLYGGRGSLTIPTGLTGLSKITDHFVSLFGNMAYTFLNKYILSGSVRKDAANLFGVNINNKWKPFWSLGASWIVSKESFFKPAFVNFLKVRGSFGYTGNVNNSLTPYTIITSAAASSSIFNLPYYYIQAPANPSLSWETIKQVNLGIDFRLFDDRFSGSVEHYTKRSDNLILTSAMDVTTGIEGIARNSASMSISGVEFSGNVQIIKRPFSWNTEFSFNHVQNKILDYIQDNSKVTIGSVVSASGLVITPRKGYSPYALFSFPTAGLDPQTGDPVGYLGKSESKNYTAIRNQLFDTTNVIYHGSSIPVIFGNFNQVFAYKNLSLVISADYRLGYYFRKTPLSYSALVVNGVLHRDYSKRWMQPGDELITNVPSLVYPIDNGDRDFFYRNSSVNALRGDNIKLRAIRLSYTFNKVGLSTFKIQRIQLYGVMENLGIIWRMNDEGLDPDVNTGNAIYPLPKRMSCGVKIEF